MRHKNHIIDGSAFWRNLTLGDVSVMDKRGVMMNSFEKCDLKNKGFLRMCV